MNIISNEHIHITTCSYINFFYCQYMTQNTIRLKRCVGDVQQQNTSQNTSQNVNTAT